MSKPAIIFDLGGVLVDWNPRYLYRKLFVSEADMEIFLRDICDGDWNEQQDAGRPFAEGVALLCAQHPEHTALIRAFHERWIEMVAGPIEGTVEIFRELRAAGYQIAALSNWSAETWALTRPLYPFFDWFEEMVISGHEGVIKPNPRIYQILLQRIGRRAHECVFIDDSMKNIGAARAMGFRTIQFRSPEQARRELNAMQILPTGAVGESA
ncbi:MAG: HAD family hydrolase [Blastocatellia bacterium]